MSNNSIDNLVEELYTTSVEGHLYDFISSQDESRIETIKNIICKSAGLSIEGENVEQAMKRFIIICKCVSFDYIVKFVNNLSSSSSIFTRCKEQCLICLKEERQENPERLINTMLINIATLNTGRSYEDITEQVGATIEDFDSNDTSFTAVSVSSSLRTDTLLAFTQFVIDITSQDNIMLKTEEKNILYTDMIKLLTGDEIDYVTITFNGDDGSVSVLVGDETPISPVVLGEMYIRYTENMRECRKLYGFIGSAPAEELIKGIDYEDVCDYLISTGEFSESEIYLENDNEKVILEPLQAVMVMNGVQTFQKPVGLLMRNENYSSIKDSCYYFVPIVSNASKEDYNSDSIEFSNTFASEMIVKFPKASNIFMLNPTAFRACSTAPKILSNIQISNIDISEIANSLKAKIAKSIDISASNTYLTRLMGVGRQ